MNYMKDNHELPMIVVFLAQNEKNEFVIIVAPELGRLNSQEDKPLFVKAVKEAIKVVKPVALAMLTEAWIIKRKVDDPNLDADLSKRPSEHADRQEVVLVQVETYKNSFIAMYDIIHTTNGEIELVDNPASLPPTQNIARIEEPYFKVGIITPKDYTGTLMELCQSRRGEMLKIEYLSPDRVELSYAIPLAEVVVDFFDQMKSRSQGYASLDYELDGYRESHLVKVDLLLNGIAADAFSTIVHRDRAFDYGRRMCEKLKELIPRQMFDVPIQAAIGGKVISRETVKAKRKDVLAKCYGGDITRKRKLLEKQKEGKKKMKSIGRVEVPGDVFIAALKLDD